MTKDGTTLYSSTSSAYRLELRNLFLGPANLVQAAVGECKHQLPHCAARQKFSMDCQTSLQSSKARPCPEAHGILRRPCDHSKILKHQGLTKQMVGAGVGKCRHQLPRGAALQQRGLSPDTAHSTPESTNSQGSSC